MVTLKINILIFQLSTRFSHHQSSLEDDCILVERQNIKMFIFGVTIVLYFKLRVMYVSYCQKFLFLLQVPSYHSQTCTSVCFACMANYKLLKSRFNPLSASTLPLTSKIVWRQTEYNNKVGCIIAHMQAQGRNSGPASKARYFVKRPFS